MIPGLEDASPILPAGHDLAQPASFGQAASATAPAQADWGIGLDFAALLGWAYMAFFVGAVAFRSLRA